VHITFLMAVHWTDLLGTVFTVLATSLALGAINDIGRLRDRVAHLENNAEALRARLGVAEQLLEPEPVAAADALGNATANIFYAGVDTSITLEEPLLGPAPAGDLDAYDTIHPALLAYGTAVVRGTGRLVLDGDASDIIMKIDNTYFSVREMFGFGSALNYEAAPAVHAEPPSPVERELCTSTHLLDPAPGAQATNCAYRKNWGVDACFNATFGAAEPICVCGGGWQSLSRVVRVRHFVQTAAAASYNALQDAFFAHSAQCCAPHAEGNAGPCNISGFAWLDTALRCDDTSHRLCDAVDRSDYIGFYAQCNTRGALRQNCTLAARAKVNAHTWIARRDTRFDDGSFYALQLTASVERLCTGLQLAVVDASDYADAYPAVYTCGGGARLWFERANTRDADSPLRGAQYYILATRKSARASWLCLSDHLSPADRARFIGDAPAFAPDQLAWLPFPAARAACQTPFLGNREPFAFARAPDARIGIYTDAGNDYARAAANADFALLPL
jgi:hypothetical protein